MLDRRSLYRDLTALALVALVVFLTLALVSYDRADPVATPLAPFHVLHQPNPSVHPANAQVHNVCGHWGALASDALFTWLGVGAYRFITGGIQPIAGSVSLKR